MKNFTPHSQDILPLNYIVWCKACRACHLIHLTLYVIVVLVYTSLSTTIRFTILKDNYRISTLYRNALLCSQLQNSVTKLSKFHDQLIFAIQPFQMLYSN